MSSSLGSQTAMNGFANEDDIVKRFNSWQTDTEARMWIEIMGYDLNKIESVTAVKLPRQYKSDINVKIVIKLKDAIDNENIQVKLVSNEKGFNQIDRRWLAKCVEQWEMPSDVLHIMQLFTGEVKHSYKDTKETKRLFLNELSQEDQKVIIDWFTENKFLVVSDVIKGRGEFSVEWYLVAQKTTSNSRWVLKNINQVLNHYSIGDVVIKAQGSLRIGRVDVQRKGGDGGRDSANQLQFKIDPTELFDIH